jgi:hypothetical protein
MTQHVVNALEAVCGFEHDQGSISQQVYKKIRGARESGVTWLMSRGHDTCTAHWEGMSASTSAAS